jgi:hypothetical protein
MGSDHAGSHRRANGSSESVSGLSIYDAIVMIIVKRHPPFFSHSQSMFPYAKYQQLLASELSLPSPVFH